MARPRTRRRANGEGSVYRRTDGRWVSSITTGFNDRGRQVRKDYYGASRAAVLGKLNEARTLLAEGRPLFP